jgi:amino acid efflux transporter
MRFADDREFGPVAVLPGPGTAGRGRTAHPPELRIATQLCAQVLGAGMLVMPPVVAALAGRHSIRTWSAHILLGACISLMLAALVRARVRPASLAATVGALLGRRAEQVVDGAFAVAFCFGQAAIAWYAGTCLLTGTTGSVPRSGAVGLLLALGVLAVAVLAALGPLSLPAALLRLRPWVAGAVALACAGMAWAAVPAEGAHTPLAPAGLSADGAQWLALVLLFFAGVGWEAVTAVPTDAARPGRVAAGVALGAAGVAVVYLGLATVRQLAVGTSGGSQHSMAAPLRWVLAIATVAVLSSYCCTNVRTAAGIASRLLRGRRSTDVHDPAKRVIAAVGLACGAIACAAAAGDGAVSLLLLGPAAAALIGYGLAAVAAVRRGGPLLRCAAAAVLLVLLGMVVPAVPVLIAA